MPAVCIKENPSVYGDEFLPTMRQSFEQRGIHTSLYQGERPADCRYHVDYTANWTWDIFLYLVFADIKVYDDNNMIGRVVYDARGGGLRLDKFGPGTAKLEQLMAQLLGSVMVPRVSGTPSPVSVITTPGVSGTTVTPTGTPGASRGTVS